MHPSASQRPLSCPFPPRADSQLEKETGKNAGELVHVWQAYADTHKLTRLNDVTVDGFRAYLLEYLARQAKSARVTHAAPMAEVEIDDDLFDTLTDFVGIGSDVASAYATPGVQGGRSKKMTGASASGAADGYLVSGAIDLSGGSGDPQSAGDDSAMTDEQFVTPVAGRSAKASEDLQR